MRRYSRAKKRMKMCSTETNHRMQCIGGSIRTAVEGRRLLGENPLNIILYNESYDTYLLWDGLPGAIIQSHHFDGYFVKH